MIKSCSLTGFIYSRKNRHRIVNSEQFFKSVKALDNFIMGLRSYWESRVLLGPLPQGFLDLEGRNTQQQQEEADKQTALAMYQLQMQSMDGTYEPRVARLSIAIVQAKLAKNYGMTRMDPYVRVRVGHAIYETHTCSNGAKNPHWNKVIHCYLPRGIAQIYLEIYDECSFVMDELIAWCHIEIPPQVLQKEETYEDWYLLSGKQGNHLEGSINLVFSYTAKPHPYMSVLPDWMTLNNPNFTPSSVGALRRPQYTPVNVYATPPAIASSMPNAENELKQISEMFPNVDKEVIKTVYDANNGKKDLTINSLLQMCD
ncbi:toll-interacting protein A [Ptiloglossa arizonensis]|uniref:toll-interacting protein A n=1 Tax=Ptiloglossa arizonensis TaxID=3350558 RepID=UPI003FA0D790